MNIVSSIINSVADAAIATKQGLANHTEVIPSVPPWIPIISVKPIFAIT